MTEKDYSGATTSKIGKNVKVSKLSGKLNTEIKTKQNPSEKNQDSKNSSDLNIKDYQKAGEIAKKVKDYAKSIIKSDMFLVEIAEKIEAEIVKLSGELAFPVNLSIDDVAAHYTPTLHDEKKATGLLKVDIGVHVNGSIADLAFSIDLTPEKRHTKIIEASETALKSALELVKKDKEKTKLNEIGKIIKKTLESKGFSPIVNLSGHSLDEFNVHSGLTIPNHDNSVEKEIGDGAFAIEPFAISKAGSGAVYDGADSNICHITGDNQVRDNFSREVLGWIIENKKSLPFSKRELEKEFGSRALMAVSNLKRAGIISEYAQLIEKNHQPVSQAETSLLIHDGKVEILVD